MQQEAYWKKQKILVTGGSGFLGSNVVDLLREKGVKNIEIPRREKQDLRNREVCKEIVQNKTIIFHLAGNVGGIGYNREKGAEMLYDNLIMGVELMEAARKAKVKKFITVGTICSYPKKPKVPFREEELWNGYPEEITGPYGIVKKMLLVQGQVYRRQYDFNAIFLLPTNLYGPNDHSTHVIAQLVQKFCEAKKRKRKYVTVWGTGKATRDFLYVRDAALGLILAAEKYNKPDPVNLGSGKETSIRELTAVIAKACNYTGSIQWDKTKPEGQPRRLLDISRAKREFGFNPKTSLEEGIQKTVDWYLSE
ncbi:GDP-L-fucose synthase [Candidatus Peregrinibacteria bacterium]|nr:GDP-L-fucose synthase [Candidatus Peregrinibacteria bacterium]